MNVAMMTNLAYFIILIGVMMGIFALLTPGTGFLELGALGGFVVGGWAVFALPINIWALVILTLGVFPFFIALRRTKQKGYLAISAFAMAFGSAYLFQGEGWLPGVHPLVALVGSTSSGWLLWIMTVKVLEAEAIPPIHDLAVIIGSIGEARTNIHHEGTVYVRGEMWTASSPVPIKSGSSVRVVAREGLVLLVEKNK